MVKTKNKKKLNTFEDIVLDAYEKETERSLARGGLKSVDNFEQRRKEIEKAARDTLDLRKTKRVTFRISQADLIKLKVRAKQKSIPYQTLLTALIRNYIDGEYSVKL